MRKKIDTDTDQKAVKDVIFPHICISINLLVQKNR